MDNGRLSAGLTLAAVFVCLAYLAYWAAVHYPAFDHSVSHAVRRVHSRYLSPVMYAATRLGNWEAKLAFAALGALLMLRIRHFHDAAVIVVSALGGEVIVGVLKAWLHRPRPPAPYMVPFIPSYGFPSDHAFSAVAVYGLILYYMHEASEEWSTKAVTEVAGISLIALVGFSRLYLGVHWTTDVLGGYALGTAWAALLVTLAPRGFSRAS
jgi:membrane-associated phospholipid phosphatase